MANTIISIRSSGVVGNTPSTLQPGELAINYADGKLYYGDSNSAANLYDAASGFQPAGLNGEIQFNSFGLFGSSESLKYDTANNVLIVSNILVGTINVSPSIVFASTTANTANQRAVTSGTYANAAYAQANTANTNAATADQRAVTSGSYANSAFTRANTANTNAATADQRAVTSGLYANAAFGVANTAITNAATADQRAVTSGSYANNAFVVANTASINALSAGSYANSAYIQANTAITNAATADQRAVTSGTYANAAFGVANTASINATSAGSYANSAFTRANTANTNAATADQRAVTSGVYANAAFGVANTASANSISAGSYANGAFTFANTANTYFYGVNATQNTNITTANNNALSAGSYANSAYTLANSKFASAGGTISGDVNVTGNLIVTGQTVYANTTNLNIGDAIITLNADIPIAQLPTENAGIEVDRGSSANTLLLWNETSDRWTFTNDGTNYSNIGSAAAETYSNSAYTQANTADQRAVTSGTYANAAFVVANAAFIAANSINATDDNTTTTLYPVMVGAAGSNQTPKVDVATTPLVYNASTGTLTSTNLAATNVGINGAAPQTPLDVISNASGYGITLRGRASDNVSSFRFASNDYATQYASLDSGSTYLLFGISGTEKMRLTSTGLGIGTTAPSVPLHVYGTSFPLARIERVTTQTTGVRSTFSAVHKTSLDMTDGFGSDFSFMIEDSSGVSNEIANFGAYRDGADNNGALAFYTRIGGSKSERMTIRADGNVGIGTTAPDANLTVNGAASFAAGTALLPSIARAGDLNTGFWFPAADTIAASTAGSERLRVDSAGNVGIGTTAPTQKLDVNGNISLAGNGTSNRYIALLNEGNTYAGTLMLQAGAGSASYGGAVVMYGPLHASYPGAVYIGASATTGSSIVFGRGGNGGPAVSESMRIDSAGNLGIGTTSPATLLDVRGNSGVASGGSTPVAIRIGATDQDGGSNTWNTSADFAQLQFHSADGSVPGGNNIRYTVGAVMEGVAGGTTALAFRSSSSGALTERLRITSAGNVGIGTTTPASKLDVVGTTKSSEFQISSTAQLDESTATTTSNTQTSIASWSATTFGGGKVIVEAKDGVNRHITELLITHNGTIAIATEYGIVHTNGQLATYDVDISSGNIRLLATAASANSTAYKVMQTLLFA